MGYPNQSSAMLLVRLGFRVHRLDQVRELLFDRTSPDLLSRRHFTVVLVEFFWQKFRPSHLLNGFLNERTHFERVFDLFG